MEVRTAQEIWETALGELQVQVSKPNYRTWLEKTAGLSYQDKQFTVGVPNTFVAEYLDKNQRSLIEKTLVGLTRQDIKVTFHVDGRQQNSPISYAQRQDMPSVTPTVPPRFNPRYTFDSFIVGTGNRLAHAAALGVAENPGHSYNPLFIYGGVGLGKTHLLQAIGHMALASGLVVLYAPAEQFTNELTNAIRDRKTQEFRNKYRSVDVLLIDDIPFISGKEQTEENFFHTFNELHNANHQITITSDCPPKSISLLQERLRSRFEWGLIAEIQPPDLETRLAILQAKTQQIGINIASDVLELIALRAQQNIRELEGTLNRVIAFAKLIRATPTPELAAQALEDIATKEPERAYITPDQIIEAVANSFQLTPPDLKSQKRKQATVARQVAIYLIKQETNCSLAQIGQELGGRDPSFVSRAYRKVVSEIDTSPYLRRKIRDIQQTIHSQKKVKN